MFIASSHIARARFDPLVTSLAEVRRLLDEDSLTSEEFVQIYLEQINKHNDYLRAVSITTPKPLLLEQARKFDAAKRNGVTASKLGSLGGIPILIKVGALFRVSMTFMEMS